MALLNEAIARAERWFACREMRARRARPPRRGRRPPAARRRHARAVDELERPMTGAPRDVTPLPDLLHGRSRVGPVRDRRPVYVDLLPPCNAGCPAGENIQAWLAHTTAGRHEQAWRELVADNPLPGDPRAGLLPPVRERLQPRESGQRGLDPFGRAVPRRPRARAGLGVRPARDRAPASGCSSSAPGPAGCRPPTTCARLGHDVEIRDAGAEPGGMMRYGIPAYRLPRDVLDAEIEPDRRAGRADDLRPPGRGPRGRAASRAASTRSSSRSAPTWPSASTSRPATPGRSSTRCRSCAAWPPASAR